MKERTKQILRYVACGLGGLALGIGLLGGLSMCATSGNKKTEDVNTILTTERVKHNASGTTDAGYTYYRMEVPLRWYMANDNGCYYQTYDVDISTYDLTSIGDSVYTGAINNLSSSQSISQAILNKVAYVRPIEANSVRFLAMFGKSDIFSQGVQRKWAYFSFCLRNGDTMGILPKSFVLTTPWKGSGMKVATSGISYAWYADSQGQNYYTLTYEESDVYLWDSALEMDGWEDTYLYFQDVVSYYSQQGYDSGYSTGHTEGYSEGYAEAYAEKDSGIAFTSCGVYPNAQVTLATDETIGNFKYMYLCHYITKPGYDEHTIYIMWTTNANTGQYLGEVIDRNDTDSYDPAVTLGSFTQQATSSVTITATQDMEFSLWVGYITTFHNRGEITNSILWFQGGTSESDMQIYQNGYDEGYQNGNQQGQETGYEEGYDRGHEVGDAEGYSRGYTEGFNQTNTKNVFSLFTSAFDSVASFFDLKIFGFLPLYWFFLAPLFIALISLLMRMVKH